MCHCVYSSVADSIKMDQFSGPCVYSFVADSIKMDQFSGLCVVVLLLFPVRWISLVARVLL